MSRKLTECASSDWGELPNDMKMLCFFGGVNYPTLPNIFQLLEMSPKMMLMILKKCLERIGNHSQLQSDLQMQKKVSEFQKNVLSKSTVSNATKRSKLTSYIASLKSRQEMKTSR